MAGYNGAGIWDIRYNFVADASNGIKILASRQDQMWADVKASYQNVLCLDGQTKPSADINWNSKKITALANGSAASDAAAFGQINSNLSAWINESNGVTWVNATQVKFVGVNLVSRYQAGIKVAFLDNSIQRYAYVTSSAFGADTTLTLALDDASAMVGPTTSFQYSVANPNHLAAPVLSAVSVCNTSSQNVTVNTNTKVVLDAEGLDTLGEFDAVTNSRFTALYTGRYLVNAALTEKNSSAGRTVNIVIFKNGATTTRPAPVLIPAAAGYTSLSLSEIMYLVAGDNIELFIKYAAADANNFINAGAASLTIARVN